MSALADRLAVAYARGIVRWRWLVVLLSLLAALSLISGARFLSFTSDYRVFFGEDNPQLTAYESLQNIYTKTDNILFVIKPTAQTVATANTLSAVKVLTEEAWKIPYSIRVDSLTNYQHTEADGDDLVVADLAETPETLDATGLARVAEIALSEPVLAARLIARDAGATGVNVTLQLPEDDAIALDKAVSYAEALAERIAADYPGLRIGLTGLAPLSNAFPRASQVDMGTLVPIMFAVIAATLLIFLRSLGGTVLTLVVTALSAMAAMGAAGWMGIRLTPPSAMAPNIILTIAIADCVHILISTFHEMRHGKSRREAVIESLRINMQPVFLTSLTTAIGFLSLNFSDSPPFNDLGNMSAVGVVAAWVLSIAFLPAAVAILPIKIKPFDDGKRGAMDRFADFVIGRRRTLLWGMTALVILLISFVPRIELDDRFIEYFDESIPFRVDSDFAREVLTGVYQIEYSVGAAESGGISDPDYLARLDAFTAWFRAQPGVVHVNSFTDVIKRLNKSMNGDDPAFYTLPDNRELAAQYLLLYEMSLPYGLDLNSQINVDKSATRFTVTLDDVSSEEMRAIALAGQRWLEDNAPPFMVSEGSGASVMFAFIANRNIASMIGGTFIAFLLISGIMVFALRSLKLGLISLVPNLVPAAMAFGLWGLLVGQVGIAASVVTATSLGLIVDASVHFLSKYNRARRERRQGPVAAIRYSFHTVGSALWVTTAILVLGFAVLAFSSFKVNGDMGLLTAITIAIALAVDFLLLPLLLMLVERREAAPELARLTPTPQAAE